MEAKQLKKYLHLGITPPATPTSMRTTPVPTSGSPYFPGTPGTPHTPGTHGKPGNRAPGSQGNIYPNLSTVPTVKALVVWGVWGEGDREAAAASPIPVYTWDEFLNLGTSVTDADKDTGA
jgi:hypothetical protein